MSVYLDDGYTETITIDEVEFVFRPLSKTEIVAHSNRYLALDSKRDKYVAENTGDDAAKIVEQQDGLLFAKMAEKLVSWGVRDSKDSAVDVSAAAVAKLRPNVITALWKAMNGVEGDLKN